MASRRLLRPSGLSIKAQLKFYLAISRKLKRPLRSTRRRRKAKDTRFPSPAPSINISAQVGGGQRLQPVFRIVSQALIALCHSIRRRFSGSGGRNVAVGPGGYLLRVNCRRVRLEGTELLLLLGIQPPLTTSLPWRLVEAAVPVGHLDGLTTCCQP